MIEHPDWLRYGALVPLPLILDHPRFASLSKLGLELRRAASRNASFTTRIEAGATRSRLARIKGIDYPALTQVCTARRAMDTEVLKRALAGLGKDWRAIAVRFDEAFEHRGRSLRTRPVRMPNTELKLE